MTSEPSDPKALSSAQKAAILARLDAPYGNGFWSDEAVNDVRDLLAALDQCEQQLAEARRLIGTWREEARLARPLESAPITLEKRERIAKWMMYTNRANELAHALGLDGPEHQA